MMAPRLIIAAGLASLAFLAVGCASDTGSSPEDVPAPTDTLTLDSKADSVAYRLVEAHGADAFASARYLRFNFGFASPKGTQVIARHLWDRTTGDYRVEWDSGPDSAYVAVINVRDVDEELPAGDAYLNGSKLTGEASEEARRHAYGRFINDSYWLLAPVKVFDPDVHREYVPDSSTAQHDVLHLTFGDVGMTPDDEYWMWVSKETGRLDRWAYHLQSMDDGEPPQAYDWTNYETLQAPAGSVELATRKQVIEADRALLTNELVLPSSPPEGAFTDPEPLLAADANGGS